MFNQEKFNQIHSQIQYRDNQSTLMVSNQYFTILKQLNDEGKLKSTHIPFTYAYIYYMTYIFRYTKYDFHVPKASYMKELLGYHADDKRLNYIIKDSGLLDSENILKPIYDFPVIHQFDKFADDLIEFTFLSDLGIDYANKWKSQQNVKNNQSSKYPVLGFHGDKDEFEDIILHDEGGTFFDFYNVTNIPFEVFSYCMSNEDIGVTGFYLYSFLQYKNNIFSDYRATYQTIGKEIGLSAKTIQRYMDSMRSFNLIETIHNMEYFSTGINKDNRLASTHKVNPFDQFTIEKIEFEKLKMVTKGEHIKSMKDKKEENHSHILEFDIDKLPF
ncbi:MAG TPA: hypothetical protein VNR61_19165 [Niallia sp.]|nr:hypothetical protein [Niallia sp.]